MSINAGLSSRLRKGFPAPPSLSMLPAHTFQLIGFRGSAPMTRPKQIRKTDAMVSILMSRGRE